MSSARGSFFSGSGVCVYKATHMCGTQLVYVTTQCIYAVLDKYFSNFATVYIIDDGGHTPSQLNMRVTARRRRRCS